MSALARTLLIIGVALSASAGAQLSAPTLAVQATLARASLAQAALDASMREGAEALSTMNAAAAMAAIAAAKTVKKEPPLARVSSWGSRAGLLFGLGVLLLVAGGLLARRVEAASLGSSEGTAQEGMTSPLATQLEGLLRELEALYAQGEALQRTLGPYPGPTPQLGGLQAGLSALSSGPVAELGEQRRQLQHQLGLRDFAILFSEFSGAERNLNRAWSALTDGHLGEAMASLDRAREAMRRCQVR